MVIGKQLCSLQRRGLFMPGHIALHDSLRCVCCSPFHNPYIYCCSSNRRPDYEMVCNTFIHCSCICSDIIVGYMSRIDLARWSAARWCVCIRVCYTCLVVLCHFVVCTVVCRNVTFFKLFFRFSWVLTEKSGINLGLNRMFLDVSLAEIVETVLSENLKASGVSEQIVKHTKPCRGNWTV